MAQLKNNNDKNNLKAVKHIYGFVYILYNHGSYQTLLGI